MNAINLQVTHIWKLLKLFKGMWKVSQLDSYILFKRIMRFTTFQSLHWYGMRHGGVWGFWRRRYFQVGNQNHTDPSNANTLNWPTHGNGTKVLRQSIIITPNSWFSFYIICQIYFTLQRLLIWKMNRIEWMWRVVNCRQSPDTAYSTSATPPLNPLPHLPVCVSVLFDHFISIQSIWVSPVFLYFVCLVFDVWPTFLCIMFSAVSLCSFMAHRFIGDQCGTLNFWCI